MEHGGCRSMFGGPSTYSSLQSFYPTSPSSFGAQPQTLQVGHADATPFPPGVSDVFYGAAAVGDGGSLHATAGPQRLAGYHHPAASYDTLQPDTDIQPPYFPPPAAVQPAGVGLFVHHGMHVPVTHQQQQSLQQQPVVDQSMYWSPINNTASVYTTSGANVDQHKTYHSLQQVGQRDFYSSY